MLANDAAHKMASLLQTLVNTHGLQARHHDEACDLLVAWKGEQAQARHLTSKVFYYTHGPDRRAAMSAVLDALDNLDTERTETCGAGEGSEGDG